MSIPVLVDEKPTFVPGGDREAREMFLVAPHARTQGERGRRLVLAGGFGSSHRLE